MSGVNEHEIEDGVFEDVETPCAALVPVTATVYRAATFAVTRPNASCGARPRRTRCRPTARPSRASGTCALPRGKRSEDQRCGASGAGVEPSPGCNSGDGIVSAAGGADCGADGFGGS